MKCILLQFKTWVEVKDIVLIIQFLLHGFDVVVVQVMSIRFTIVHFCRLPVCCLVTSLGFIQIVTMQKLTHHQTNKVETFIVRVSIIFETLKKVSLSTKRTSSATKKYNFQGLCDLSHNNLFQDMCEQCQSHHFLALNEKASKTSQLNWNVFKIRIEQHRV